MEFTQSIKKSQLRFENAIKWVSKKCLIFFEFQRENADVGASWLCTMATDKRWRTSHIQSVWLKLSVCGIVSTELMHLPSEHSIVDTVYQRSSIEMSNLWLCRIDTYLQFALNCSHLWTEHIKMSFVCIQTVKELLKLLFCCQFESLIFLLFECCRAFENTSERKNEKENIHDKKTLHSVKHYHCIYSE